MLKTHDKRGNPLTNRVVFGISDWPENMGEEFAIFQVRVGETDEEAIERAREAYDSDTECIIREIEE